MSWDFSRRNSASCSARASSDSSQFRRPVLSQRQGAEVEHQPHHEQRRPVERCSAAGRGRARRRPEGDVRPTSSDHAARTSGVNCVTMPKGMPSTKSCGDDPQRQPALAAACSTGDASRTRAMHASRPAPAPCRSRAAAIDRQPWQVQEKECRPDLRDGVAAPPADLADPVEASEADDCNGGAAVIADAPHDRVSCHARPPPAVCELRESQEGTLRSSR